MSRAQADCTTHRAVMSLESSHTWEDTTPTVSSQIGKQLDLGKIWLKNWRITSLGCKFNPKWPSGLVQSICLEICPKADLLKMLTTATACACECVSVCVLLVHTSRSRFSRPHNGVHYKTAVCCLFIYAAKLSKKLQSESYRDLIRKTKQTNKCRNQQSPFSLQLQLQPSKNSCLLSYSGDKCFPTRWQVRADLISCASFGFITAENFSSRSNDATCDFSWNLGDSCSVIDSLVLNTNLTSGDLLEEQGHQVGVDSTPRYVSGGLMMVHMMKQENTWWNFSLLAG